ncbi:cupin domain-containing protein [candidate division KSB1 bacterium]|nr:cupin domain-containing protein [candidate division KSB1 bacterium]
MTDKNSRDQFPSAIPVNLASLIDYAPQAVVSRTIAKNAAGTLTIFAFDKDESLSEHTAPFDAFVQILDGEGELTISGEKVVARQNETVLMPANIPHAVYARQPFKMFLIMLKEK